MDVYNEINEWSKSGRTRIDGILDRGEFLWALEAHNKGCWIPTNKIQISAHHKRNQIRKQNIYLVPHASEKLRSTLPRLQLKLYVMYIGFRSGGNISLQISRGNKEENHPNKTSLPNLESSNRIEPTLFSTMEAESEDHSKSREDMAPPPLTPSFPQGKIKRIMKLDRDIKKATSEATLAISIATELFIQSLAAGAHTEISRRGRRIIRGEHVRSAVRAHQPTADFLLDSLSQPPRPSSRLSAGATCQAEAEGKENEKEKVKPLPRGAQRIDQFFQKTSVDVDPSPAIEQSDL
jgi:Histone-like transcription factor (CBF/NF-Y) and archaeal histone